MEPYMYPCPVCKEPYSFLPPEEWHVDPHACKKCRTALRKQNIMFMVGPDMCGKTNIGKALSEALMIPYFKASSEHNTYLGEQNKFLNQLKYADPRVYDLLKQTKQSVIFDRGYPCEWAYAAVLKRETDEEFVLHMDELYASLGASIVFCHRTSYKNIVDDIDPKLCGERLEKLDAEYRNFLANFTKCKYMLLNVDDENLDREVREIAAFIATKDRENKTDEQAH